MTNDDMLLRVAPILGQLPWRSVFLGGATTHLCVTDPSAPEPTRTDDVDVVVDISSPVEYQVNLRESLLALGAKEDTSEDAPLCRWRLAELSVDIMSPSASALGFTNRWYQLALETSREIQLSDGTVIRVISPPVFVATKLEAYLSRGNGDCLASKDIEDVIAVFDGRPELLDELRASREDLRDFVAREFQRLLEDPNFHYAVEGYLDEAPGRSKEVFRRLEALVAAHST